MTSADFELTYTKDIKLSYKLPNYEIGDIFNSQVYFGRSTIFKTWHTNISSGTMGRREYPVKICTRYHSSLNILVLIINGEVKLKIEPKFDPQSKSFVLAFKLHDQPVQLVGERAMSLAKYNFRLLVDKVELKDIKACPITKKESHSPRAANIPQYRTATMQSKPVILYQVFCEASNHETFMVERRYSEFDRFDHILRNNLPPHILSTLPKLPGKVFNPFVDQNEVHFISQRKERLEKYLNFLLNNETVRRTTFN